MGESKENKTLSRVLEAKLFQFDLKVNRFVRYPIVLFKTFYTFITKDQKNICRKPSIILSLFAVNYGRVLNIPVIVDAHNAGVYPFDGSKEWANRITAHLFRFATFTIVTNDALADYVRSKGGRPVVLPDPIPEFSHQPSKKI